MKLSAILGLLLPVLAQAFSGSSATEAKLGFEHFVDVPVSVYESKNEVEHVTEQISHMFGPMTFRPSTSKSRGADKGTGEPVILSTESIGTGDEAVVRIHYAYETVAVIGNGPRTQYLLALPRTPFASFNKGGGESSKNKCTDDHYTSFGDYWYFWSPWRKGCGGKLLKEGTDYDLVTATIERVPNVTNSEETSYPEYDRLAKNGKIKIFLLMGMDEPTKNRNPLAKGNRDLNGINFEKIRDEILKIGLPSGRGKAADEARKQAKADITKTFQPREWTNPEIREVVEEDTNPLPYVESFTKQFPGNARADEVEVIMFFGKTGIDQGSKGFHWFMKYALSQASIMIYDGHSGLGGHLDLREIEKLRTKTLADTSDPKEFRFYLPKERYQIYYFNSCSSYTYYNSMYFNRKKTADTPGTKNLDIIGTGLETDFEGGVETNMSLITTTHNYVANGTIKSYRSLLKEIENDNLSGVNGDEDNPKSQDKVGDGK